MAQPRNKYQKMIVALSKKLPKLTRTQRADAFKMHKKYIRVTYKHGNACLHCGHEWKADNSPVRETGKGKCPKCKQIVLKVDAPKNTPFQTYNWWQDEKVYGVIDTIEGFQVVRYFMSTLDMAKGRKRKHLIRELAQHFITEKGKVSSLYAPNGGSMYNLKWGHGDLEFRLGTTVGYKWGEEAHKYWKVKRFIPTLRRNGIKRGTNGITPHILFRGLLTNPMIETLYKAGHYGLVERAIHGRTDLNKYWGSIKMLIRNDYKLTWKTSEWWLDYVDTLEDMGMDTRNPEIVCPEALKNSHDTAVKKRNAKRAKQDYELKKLRDTMLTKGYQESRGKLLDLMFSEGDLTIEPLKTVEDFYLTGETLHHCVGTYYKRKHSLILSAKMKDELVEAIEISLKDYRIVQVRGLCNKPSQYNGQVRELVEKNIQQIMKVA
jgi:hypothetical protein